MEKVREQLNVRKERAVLVGAVLRGRGQTNHDDDLVELTALARSAGAVVVDRFQQKVEMGENRNIDSMHTSGDSSSCCLQHAPRQRALGYAADLRRFDYSGDDLHTNRTPAGPAGRLSFGSA